MNCAWLALGAVPASLYSQTLAPSAHPIGVADKLRFHAQRVVSPASLLGWAAYSGWQQWRDVPREWGQGASGYGQRYASNLGYMAVRHAMGFALDSSLHEDPRYFQSKRIGVLARTGDVVRQTFISRTNSGRETLAVWRVGSAYGAGFVSNAWLPKSAASAGDALMTGTLAIVSDTGLNWFREFWPDIRKKLRRK
jgi:hypothetical protein